MLDKESISRTGQRKPYITKAGYSPPYDNLPGQLNRAFRVGSVLTDQGRQNGHSTTQPNSPDLQLTGSAALCQRVPLARQATPFAQLPQQQAREADDQFPDAFGKRHGQGNIRRQP